MISYFYKRALPIITLLVTSASVAWSASYTEAIRETRDLSLQQYMLSNSYLRFTKLLLDNVSYKQVLDIIIISKDKLHKQYNNVKNVISEENESKAEISLNEQVIAAFPELNFVYFDVSTADEEMRGNKFIYETFETLEYMVYQNNRKNFVIYMDFNVKYEKNLYKFITDKFKTFKDNSIIITNSELGDNRYNYLDLTFMIPAFNRGSHVLMVGPENLKIDPKKLHIDKTGLSSEEIKTKKLALAHMVKTKLNQSTDIKFKQFQNHSGEQQIDAENTPIEASKKYFITNGINSHYAALQCCILTALDWLINMSVNNTEIIKKIKLEYTIDKVFDLTNFIAYIENENFKEEINLDFPEKSESKIIYFELNECDRNKLQDKDNAELKIKLNTYYDINITCDGVSLRKDKTTIKTIDWKNKGNKDTFSCLMTFEKDKINLKIDGSDYQFKGIDYNYHKINKILIKQRDFAKNFKTIVNLTQTDVLAENVDDIK